MSVSDTAFDEIGCRGHPGGTQIIDNRSRFTVGCFPAFLGMDRLKHVTDFANLAGRYVAEDIPVEMHHAALPSRLRQVLGRALQQATAGVRNNELHALKPAVDQVPQECRPARLVLFGASDGRWRGQSQGSEASAPDL